MDAHITRVQTLARDLVEQLQAGDRRAALQTLTALRARPTYRIIVRPLKDDTDPAGWHRLKAWLKAGLRGYKLQAVDIASNVTAEELAEADKAQEVQS